jgi:apolipoprotein N-acyltransferase
MKLNLNSVSARLYRWFYATSQMPQSLCPYFWKLVLMWIFILPYTILSLPTILTDSRDFDDKTTGERALMGAIYYFILGMVICMLSWVGLFFTSPTKDTPWMHMLVAGGVGWCVAIGGGSIALFKELKERREARRIKYDADGYRIWEEPKEKQPSIVVEFVKAKYNKYCPKIDWDETNR